MSELIKMNEAFEGLTVHHSFKQIVSQFSLHPYFVKNKKREFIYANPIFLEHHKMSSLESIVGKTDYDYFPTLSVKKYEREDNSILETGKPIFNIVELVHNVHRAPLSWQTTHKVPLYDQNKEIFGLIGIFEIFTKNTQQINQKTAAIVPAIDYIRKNYHKRIDMATLANICEISERTFYRHFKEAFNITPQNYLQKHRILEAIEIFRVTQSTISTVALKCGFYDHSNFTKEFKKHMSMTPKQYLQKMKEIV